MKERNSENLWYSVKTNISKDDLTELETQCQRLSVKKSLFIRHAIRELLHDSVISIPTSNMRSLTKK